MGACVSEWNQRKSLNSNGQCNLSPDDPKANQTHQAKVWVLGDGVEKVWVVGGGVGIGPAWSLSKHARERVETVQADEHNKCPPSKLPRRAYDRRAGQAQQTEE